MEAYRAICAFLDENVSALREDALDVVCGVRTALHRSLDMLPLASRGAFIEPAAIGYSCVQEVYPVISARLLSASRCQ